MSILENKNPVSNRHAARFREPGAGGERGSGTVFLWEAPFPGKPWGIPGPSRTLREAEDGGSPLSRDVAGFFEMWARIEEGFAALDASDQRAFREDKDLLPPVFQGFDGQCEGEYQRMARFMIEELGRFKGFAGRDLESYRPMVGRYRRLLEAFRPIWSRIEGRRPLTANELRAVLTR